jgi:hypothetical protein
MRGIKISLLLLLICFSFEAYSQVENVPLPNPVYDFLKEMRVKKIIPGFNDDDLSLSRSVIADYLNIAESKRNELSETERSLLRKYRNEFDKSLMSYQNTASLFGGKGDFDRGFNTFFKNKYKYLFAYDEGENNVFIDGLGSATYANEFKPSNKINSKILDIGFRIRGTVFDKLGYYFKAEKGGVWGSAELAEMVRPVLSSNFKFNENIDRVRNYDFTDGYIKFGTKPVEGMDLSVQLGREKIVYGVGYSDRLSISGNSPNMDFIKFNFNYGILNYSSVHASAVGEFHGDRSLNYTKYIASNRFKVSLENLFDIGIAESIVYSSRGIDLAYLNPVIFYKFVEHSLQDRDNGIIFADIQTHFIKNLELQGTFFLDENILDNITDLTLATNKSAYQLGLFWYEPFKVNNLSWTLEYTKIRPYVYSHVDPKNTYTSYGKIIGHPIGPNSDQIFTRLSYNYSDWVRLIVEYSKTRHGDNIYDSEGNLVMNAGGDVFVPYIVGRDNDEAFFLDGIRINNDRLKLNIVLEPVRNFIFDLNFIYNITKNITSNTSEDRSFGYLKFHINY